VTLEDLERNPARAAAAIIPMADVLPGVPVFVLSADGAKRAANGCLLGRHDSASGQSAVPSSESSMPLVRLLDSAGHLVGIGRPSESNPGFLHPAVILM
jgi:hypothetical protein